MGMKIGKKRKRSLISKNSVEVAPMVEVTPDSPMAFLEAGNPYARAFSVVDEPIEVGDDEPIDIEDASSSEVQPDSSSEDTSPQQEEVNNSTAEITYPKNVRVDTANASYYASPDGTQRVTVNVFFDEVPSAVKYNVRISKI